jgi:hypothetical protein
MPYYYLQNRNGTVEFEHTNPIYYLQNSEKWKLMQGCLPDYNSEGLCPDPNGDL